MGAYSTVMTDWRLLLSATTDLCWMVLSTVYARMGLGVKTGNVSVSYIPIPSYIVSVSTKTELCTVTRYYVRTPM